MTINRPITTTEERDLEMVREELDAANAKIERMASSIQCMDRGLNEARDWLLETQQERDTVQNEVKILQGELEATKQQWRDDVDKIRESHNVLREERDKYREVFEGRIGIEASTLRKAGRCKLVYDRSRKTIVAVPTGEPAGLNISGDEGDCDG